MWLHSTEEASFLRIQRSQKWFATTLRENGVFRGVLSTESDISSAPLTVILTPPLEAGGPKNSWKRLQPSNKQMWRDRQFTFAALVEHPEPRRALMSGWRSLTRRCRARERFCRQKGVVRREANLAACFSRWFVYRYESQAQNRKVRQESARSALGLGKWTSVDALAAAYSRVVIRR